MNRAHPVHHLTAVPALLLFGLFGLGLTACSSSGSTTDSGGSGSSVTGDPADLDRAVELRKCLRDKGFDVPDLPPGADPHAQALGQPEGADQNAWVTALGECGAGTAGSGSAQQPSTEQMDQVVELTKCLRTAGFDMPDPPAAAGGSAPAFKVPKGADPEKFLEALNGCSQ